MKNANQTTIAAAGITSTRFEVADRLFSCKSYRDASGRLIAEVGSYGGGECREYKVTLSCGATCPGNNETPHAVSCFGETFKSRAAAVRSAEERVAAWIKTETETETCSDCGGTTLRLDTASGAVDCVDCGKGIETETMTTIYYDGEPTTAAQLLIVNADAPHEIEEALAQLLSGDKTTVQIGGGAAPLVTLSTLPPDALTDVMPCEKCGCDVHVDDFCGNDKPDGTSEYLCPDCYVETETGTNELRRRAARRLWLLDGAGDSDTGALAYTMSDDACLAFMRMDDEAAAAHMVAGLLEMKEHEREPEIYFGDR